MAEQPMTWRRTMTGYVPGNAVAAEAHAKGKPNELVKMKLTRPRNLAHHQLYWVILQLVVDNSEDFDTTKQLHTAVKAALGYGKWLEIGSRPLFVEESISFASMGQTEFKVYFDRALDAINKYWLPVGVEALLAEGRAAA
ncbi:hypothetical protein ACSMXM_05695 [Pacificimonas sp. ICDLI1SI03]